MNNKKTIIALALVALIGIIGGTVAYFTSTATLTNEFLTGTYATKVTEVFESPDNWTPGTTTSKAVNVTNNGNVDIAVRASYTEKWTSANNTELSNMRNAEKIAQFEIGEDWKLATDGKYYYEGTLASGQTSSNFISAVTFNPNFSLRKGMDIECTTITEEGKTSVNCVNLESGYAGATYTLNITIETIQADQVWEHTELKTYEVGEEVTIGTETFNVISDNGDTITMLAQHNLGPDYRQSEVKNGVAFSDSAGWEYTPGPKEIDIQEYDGPVKTYVNNYVTYLQGETGDNQITGTLITLAQLKELGCELGNDEYADYGYTPTCQNSEYVKWLYTNLEEEADWWTRSAVSNYGLYYIWGVDGVYEEAKDVIDDHWWFGRNVDLSSVRPVITISKFTLEDL